MFEWFMAYPAAGVVVIAVLAFCGMVCIGNICASVNNGIMARAAKLQYQDRTEAAQKGDTDERNQT